MCDSKLVCTLHCVSRSLFEHFIVCAGVCLNTSLCVPKFVCTLHCVFRSLFIQLLCVPEFVCTVIVCPEVCLYTSLCIGLPEACSQIAYGNLCARLFNYLIWWVRSMVEGVFFWVVLTLTVTLTLTLTKA